MRVTKNEEFIEEGEGHMLLMETRDSLERKKVFQDDDEGKSRMLTVRKSREHQVQT